MIWDRQQYLSLMTFGGSPRPMFVELFGLLIGLDREWREQGASEEEIALTAFCFDYVEVVGCGGMCGPILAPPVTLREDDEMLVQRDGLGRTTQLCKKTATIPLPADFPVKNMDDWLKLKPLYEFRAERIDWNKVEHAAKQQQQGKLVIAGIPGAYDVPRALMGEELACMACYDQPELLHDILATLLDTALKTLEPISRKLQIDQLSVHEDFAGKSGPLVGPVQVLQFFKSYYRGVWDLLQSRGSRIFQQDSDGNINPVVPALLECGLTCMYPMEPAAGMNIVQMRKTYGKRVSMSGGIDKHVLRQDKAAIARELEYKLQPLMRDTGGMVFGLDHRIPNGTPIVNYRYYVETAREILGLPPCSAEQRGWARMAF